MPFKAPPLPCGHIISEHGTSGRLCTHSFISLGFRPSLFVLTLQQDSDGPTSWSSMSGKRSCLIVWLFLDRVLPVWSVSVASGATSALLIDLHQAILQGHCNLANFSRVYVQRIHHATCRFRDYTLCTWQVASSSKLREHFLGRTLAA